MINDRMVNTELSTIFLDGGFLVVNFYGMDDLYVFLTQINCLALRRCVRSLRDIFKLKFLP